MASYREQLLQWLLRPIGSAGGQPKLDLKTQDVYQQTDGHNCGIHTIVHAISYQKMGQAWPDAITSQTANNFRAYFQALIEHVLDDEKDEEE